MGEKTRPHFVPRIQKYQISITLSDRDADAMERYRVRHGLRSWNAVVVALLKAADRPLVDPPPQP